MMSSVTRVQLNAFWLLLFLLTAQLAMAQYKKVNLFTKSGRIYEMGINYRMQNGERSASPGFFISAGRSRDDRRIHHWFDMGINAGNKFDYMTVSSYSSTPGPVRVQGKSGFDYTLNYTLGYFLADNSDDEKPLLPFISGTIGYSSKINYSTYTITPDGDSPEMYPSDERGSFNAGVAAGILYRASEKIGIRLSGGYMSVTTASSGYGVVFEELKSHPVLQLALRFNIGAGE